jgi:peroxiredoxin
MHPTFCLMTCSLVLAQPAARTEWLLEPRLARGQELIYRGGCTEEVLGKGVQFNRAYRLEARVFVLELPAGGLDVAFQTTVRQKASGDDGPGSVRLEVARVGLQGAVSASPGTSLAAPTDGPPTVECGMFVASPTGRVGFGRGWEAPDEGRPPRQWRIVATEQVNGTSCLKLEGTQQSDDWEKPRADRTAWRRVDVLWVAPKLGVACRVERTIERRGPARDEPTQRLQTRYELESNLQYPGQLFNDRKREVQAARTFHEAALSLSPAPGKHGPRQFDNLLARIATHVETQPTTPYRDAVLQVRRRVEAARRGEVPPAPAAEEAAPTHAAVGRKAPDFVTTNLLTGESVRLSRFYGRPVLMVFYSPTSPTVEEVLRFAQARASAHRGGVTVLGLSASDDAEYVRRQHEEYRLDFPILSGGGLRINYAVDATPKLIVLDAAGVVRASYVGWGPETPTAVVEELKRALQR